MKHTLQERIDHYNNLIPPTYQEFPQNFQLKPLDWIISDEVIERPLIHKIIDGEMEKIRPIATMDIELLSNDIVARARRGEVDLVKNYPCGLKCPNCFSEEEIFGDTQRLMYWQDVMQHVQQAQHIGLQSIKFLGPGELFQNPDLFNILDYCKAIKMPISIFTKGAELGNDDLAMYSQQRSGVRSAKHLVERVAHYDNVRILLGFNSLFPERQDAFVGSKADSTSYRINDGVFENRGIANYTAIRDQALVNLVEAGFNSPKRGQRLTLVMDPIHRKQLDEVADAYEWGARRNMPVIIAPTMESGPKSQALVHINTAVDPENAWIAEAMISIYSRAIETGITTLDRVQKEGLSGYFGTAGCNQVANGLFLRLNGQVKMCPGTSREDAIYGNVHDTELVDIWRKSANYAMGPLKNNWCTAKTTGLPVQMQEQVMHALERKYG